MARRATLLLSQAAASVEPVTYSFQRCSAMRVRVAPSATLAFARLAHVRWA